MGLQPIEILVSPHCFQRSHVKFEKGFPMCFFYEQIITLLEPTIMDNNEWEYILYPCDTDNYIIIYYNMYFYSGCKCTSWNVQDRSGNNFHLRITCRHASVLLLSSRPQFIQSVMMNIWANDSGETWNSQSDTLWWTNIAMENGPVEIVDFPMKNGDFPVRYVKLPQW